MPELLAPPETLLIEEAAAARPSALDDDGTCLIHIIRPGRGLGKGSHFYPAQMLQENAHKFTGWPVFIDHESPAAKRARGYLPRSLEDAGGIIEESYWDPSVPAEGRFGQGAVVGRMRPILKLKSIIQEAPQLARFSIKAKATDVSEGQAEGHNVYIVEGIRDNPPGSVDAVTLDGAGGKVASLMEALEESLEGDDTVLEEAEAELEEAKLKAKARKALPDSDFAIPEKREYPIHDEEHGRKAVQLSSGKPEHGRVKSAVKKRYPNIDVQEAATESPSEGEGDNVKELIEALRDPESEVAQAVKEMAKQEATEIVEARKGEIDAHREEIVGEVREELQGDFDERLKTSVEEARAEVRAEQARKDELVELRETAHKMVDEAKLGSEKLAERIKGRFDLAESGEPTDDLDVVDQLDVDGKVVKAAKDQLVEAVEAEIADARDVLAEAMPTRVEGQGGGEPVELTEAEQEAKRKQGSEGKPKRFWREHLEESGIDPDEAYPDRKLELAEAGSGKE